MSKRYFLWSDEGGVFVGVALGLAFWSKWDRAGQDYAVTMTKDDAEEFISNHTSIEAIPIPVPEGIEIGPEGSILIDDAEKIGEER